MAAAHGIKALTFDVGGTIVDWHGTIRRELTAFGQRRGHDRDWAAVTNDWRQRALKGIREVDPTALNIDDVHRATLDEVLEKFEMAGVSDEEKTALTMAWHGLDPWPDAPAGHARLRESFTMAALTILSISLIMDISRKAPFLWDCVISCEMLGRYKPDPWVYRRAAELLAVRPDQCLMVAAHNGDLLAAKAVGFRTAFIRRPSEHGPGLTKDKEPDPSCDFVGPDLPDLARQLGA